MKKRIAICPERICIFALLMGVFLCLTVFPLFAGPSGKSSPKKNTLASDGKPFSGRVDPGPFHGEWDFGYVPVDYKMIYRAPVRNIGRDTLRVIEIKSTCECTVPTIPTRKLAPGEETPLTISFDTKKFNGPQDRFVEALTSDGRAQERILRFTAIVGGRPEEVDMRPRSILSLPGSDGDTLVIRNYLDSELAFSVAYQDTSLFVIESQEWIAPAEGYIAIFLRVHPDIKAGTYYSTFTLEFASDPPVRMSTPVKIVRY